MFRFQARANTGVSGHASMESRCTDRLCVRRRWAPRADGRRAGSAPTVGNGTGVGV